MNKLWLKNIARLNMPVYQFSSEKTRVFYAGYSAIKRNYYARMLMGKEHSHKFVGRRWYWEMPDLIRSHKLDIVIAEIGQMTLDHFQKQVGYILPEWAKMRINIERPLSELLKGSVSDFPDVLKRIRKYNLSYEMAYDEENFNIFNEKFYLPYISKRHGDEALIENLKVFWDSTPSPAVMYIKENGVIVGGSLVRKEGDTLEGLRLGLLDGNEEYLRHGVVGAIYYYGVIEGQKMGCRYMDVGGSRPFLTDGLTKYKMGLGGEFIPDCSFWRNYHWIGINDQSEWAKDFIDNNPFMHLDADQKLVRSS